MDINDALNVLSQHYPIQTKDSRTEIVAKMLNLIREKTNQFTDASGLSREPVDLKSILEKEGIKPSQWQQAKGSIDRNEYDTVQWLANNIIRLIQPFKDAAAVRARKAKALMLRLKLLSL
jgi:hypothetical protein